MDHNRPNCVSNVLYKGALQGQDARTVWVGDVLIRAEAERAAGMEAKSAEFKERGASLYVPDQAAE